MMKAKFQEFTDVLNIFFPGLVISWELQLSQIKELETALAIKVETVTLDGVKPVEVMEDDNTLAVANLIEVKLSLTAYSLNSLFTLSDVYLVMASTLFGEACVNRALGFTLDGPISNNIKDNGGVPLESYALAMSLNFQLNSIVDSTTIDEAIVTDVIDADDPEN